jgi:hypothetical protein
MPLAEEVLSHWFTRPQRVTICMPLPSTILWYCSTSSPITVSHFKVLPLFKLTTAKARFLWQLSGLYALNAYGTHSV